jgi:hypothetical protein
MIKSGLPAAGTKKISKKAAFSMRNPVFGLILAILGINTASGLAAPLIRVWRTRISEQNFYFTLIYMLIGDRKVKEIYIMWLKSHTSGTPGLNLILQTRKFPYNSMFLANYTRA